MAQDKVTREVAALIKQREQYREFLARLEERASDSNPRAVEKVKKDYEAKLRAASEQLVKHVESVREALEDAEAQVTDLEVRRDAKSEELEEARLRHSVGEFGDEKEWKAVERKLTKELQELENGVEKQIRARDNLTEILEQIEAEAKGKAAKKATPASPAPAASADDSAGTTTEPPKAGRRVRTPGQQVSEDDVASSSPEDLDLEDLDLASAPSGGSGSPPQETGGDELRFLESLSLSPTEPEEEEEKKAAPGPLSFLSKRAKGRTETIICPRCSAANDPAEWYCVECGEELPAG